MYRGYLYINEDFTQHFSTTPDPGYDTAVEEGYASRITIESDSPIRITTNDPDEVYVANVEESDDPAPAPTEESEVSPEAAATDTES